MALLATHVKFSFDISGRLPAALAVTDENEYCAGAVYPDSRYFTGIKRKLTHFEDSPQDPFAAGLTDFQRGWAAHNLYDRLATPVYFTLLPWPLEELHQFNRAWAYLTALKVVEDRAVLETFGAPQLSVLRQVNSGNRPLGENAETMAGYYAQVRRQYAEPLSFGDYGRHMEHWGASAEVAGWVVEYAEKIAADAELKKKVTGIYDKIIAGPT